GVAPRPASPLAPAPRQPPPSPPVEAGPNFYPAASQDGVVLRKLRRRRTGMVRQDAKPGADGETLDDAAVDAVCAADDAVLLVGAVNGVAGNGRAVLRADLAVAEVALLVL